jgi:hypothetical protein
LGQKFETILFFGVPTSQKVETFPTGVTTKILIQKILKIPKNMNRIAVEKNVCRQFSVKSTAQFTTFTTG